MMLASTAPLLEALDETRAGLASGQALYSATLAALADDVRAMTALPDTATASGETPQDRPDRWAGLPWTVFRDGIEIVPLAYRGDDQAAALLRYRPGASAPHHFHAGNEHIVVLSGSQQDERGLYGRGTVMLNPAGSAHSVTSIEGCIVGMFWEKPVVFLAGD